MWASYPRQEGAGVKPGGKKAKGKKKKGSEDLAAAFAALEVQEPEQGHPEPESAVQPSSTQDQQDAVEPATLPQRMCTSLTRISC